jgi:hypothetical protein
MKTPRPKLFDEIRQQSERTGLDSYKADGDMERLQRKDAKEIASISKIVEGTSRLNELKQLLRAPTGISRREILGRGFSDSEFKLLKRLGLVDYREGRWFLKQRA